MTLQYVGRHRTASFVDLTIPRVRVENAAWGVGVLDGRLHVTAADADTGNMIGLGFGPDAIAALRDALGSGREPACICGTGRSVQCASPRHAVSL